MDWGVIAAGLILVFFIQFSVPIMLVAGGIGYFIARRKSGRARWIYTLGGVLTPIIVMLYFSDICWMFAGVGELTGNDLGFSDEFDLNLPNNYYFVAMDSTTNGVVYGANAPMPLEAISGGAALWNVRQLQEEGDWLAGEDDDMDGKVPLWFLLNTRAKIRVDAKSETELEQIATSHGIKLQLETSDQFYLKHRLNFKDASILVLLLLPWIILAGVIVAWCRGRFVKVVK